MTRHVLFLIDMFCFLSLITLLLCRLSEDVFVASSESCFPTEMAGTVYLKTNRFEVKLEAITFKTKDFESLCKMDFLFPDGKVWARKPIVGLDVMCHPRDPSVILLLLCFGVGCVILRFKAGEALPAGIHRFLADKRINVVGFGIPEKTDIFPFEELGLRKSEVDIGYLAARSLKDSKYKRWELAELAQRVLGIKKMIGLTEASSFERHEQINSFLKNLNSLQLLAEGWFKVPKGKKNNKKQQPGKDNNVLVNVECNEGPFVDFLANAKIPEGDYTPEDYSPPSVRTRTKKYASCNDLIDVECSKGETGNSSDDSSNGKKPIKGILKCPSTTLLRWNSFPSNEETPPSPSTPTPSDEMCGARGSLKRANSKGCNVSFKFH
ncbi:hypothetical protein MIMGU_mgv1a008250mg [Erythranthe guttata]|uniref:3'-5' exonuclease domain-containing protein n=1 Tax=Erythranthe guttata TaxID=4155 RepID=A0A022QKC7_ERYGU|nr:hypothetical protein MIMGU_mgv1a008250mg [Erythranthe guttata]